MTRSLNGGLLSTFDDNNTDTLSWVTHTARSTLSGVDYVSICVVHGCGEFSSVGATDPLAQRADALQQELGEGPSVDAALGVGVAHCDNVENDLRWRGYGTRSAEMGIRSQTAIELRYSGRTIGVLNLYSTQLGPLEDGVIDAAQVLAQDASTVLRMTQAVDDMAIGVTGWSQGPTGWSRVEREGAAPEAAVAS
ncbi:MAG: GAF domain-containing protein [Propionibacteriales bacterium]|nr:GAF domain-containing protein [Propionibacteriales bacterium]